MSLVKQQGSALLVSLVILTVITMGAMVAMQRSGVQIRMVSNLQHQHELENAALSTLNGIYSQMLANAALQNKLIIEAEAQFKLAEDDATKPNSINPFAKVPTLVKPTFSANSVKETSSTAFKLPSPDSD